MTVAAVSFNVAAFMVIRAVAAAPLRPLAIVAPIASMATVVLLDTSVLQY